MKNVVDLLAVVSAFAAIAFASVGVFIYTARFVPYLLFVLLGALVLRGLYVIVTEP